MEWHNHPCRQECAAHVQLGVCSLCAARCVQQQCEQSLSKVCGQTHALIVSCELYKVDSLGAIRVCGPKLSVDLHHGTQCAPLRLI